MCFERNAFKGPLYIPYPRRDFYQISLVNGPFNFYYADHYVATGENTLLFINPEIPFSWELDKDQGGYCCVFTADFFSTFDFVRSYLQFQPGNVPAFDLSGNDLTVVTNIYLKLLAELNSSIPPKPDVLKILILDLIDAALKMRPLHDAVSSISNASRRITYQFKEVLEKQFPITSAKQQMKIRFAIDFANHLSVHVNHLNRAVKEITGSTTTQIIAKRLLKEAKLLLQHTNWNISEIGWCLWL